MPAVPSRVSRPTLGAALVAILLAGCGNVEHVGTSRTLNVGLSEYRITPSAFSATSGELTLVVRNYGRLTHDLVIGAGGHEQGATPSIPPGGEATLVVILSPGHYTLASTILQDADLGARGSLTVS